MTTRLVIALNGYSGPHYYQAGDALMKPGYVCTEDDADEVKICTTSTKPFGIIGCDSDHDLNSVYSLGERIPVYPLGCGVDIFVACRDTTTITITKGVAMETQDGDTTMKGHGKVLDAFSALTTTHTHATAGERGWGWPAFWLGRAQSTGSITSAIARYVPIKLSL